MSDAGIPPPPPLDPPPPPRPPNLAPPPGYAAYEPNPSSAVPLKRVGGLRTAILVLLGVFVVGTIIQIAVTPSVGDAAAKFLADRDEDAFNDKLAPLGLAGLLSGLSTIAIVVLTIVWMYRVAGNHRTLGRRLTWGPGWAIGGWFLPPLAIYAIPMLALRESWKAADPDVAPGDDRWRQGADNPLVYIWWVLYGLAPVVFLVAGLSVQIGQFSQDTQDVAESFDDQQTFMILQSIVSLAAAVSWALLVRALSDRHARLTGEARTR